MAQNLAFGLKTPRDLLEKARREVGRLRQRPIAIMAGSYNDEHETIDQAINAAISLWHIIDWLANSSLSGTPALVQHAKQISGTRKTNPYGVLRDFALQNVDLAICHDLANGSKHLELDNPQVTQPAAYGSIGSLGTPKTIEALASAPTGNLQRFVAKVVMPNGHRVPALDIYDRALIFWDDLFVRYQL